MKKEELKNLGISDNIINYYMQNKQIVLEDNNFKLSGNLLIRLFLDNLKNGKTSTLVIKKLSDDEFVQSYIQLLSYLYNGELNKARLMLTIIDESYPNSEYKDVINLYNFILNDIEVDDLKIIYDDNEFIGRSINLVKKYLRKHQYTICCDILEEILKVEDNIYLQILRNVCKNLPTNTIYIVDESNIKDEATREGIARIERKVLIELEQGESLINSKNFYNLASFGIREDIYETIIKLLQWANYYKANYRKVSNRDSRAVYGDLDDVVSALITSEDFYRLKEVIDNISNPKNPFSIKVQIYKILVDTIMDYSKRNNKFIDRERLTSLNKKNEQMLIERYPVSSISVDTIDDEVSAIKVDFSQNYFQVYKNYYNIKKYKEAKRALQQFHVNMSSLDVSMNLDYLFKELDILIESNQDSEVNKSKVEGLIKEAEEKTENDKLGAIALYLESLKYQSIKNPRIISRIGRLYLEAGDYHEALKYYKEADKTLLYPDDYITVIELLIKTKNYEEVPIYARKYDIYYPEENAYVYYLLSIAYANMSVYDLAEDALETADAINVTCYNTPIEYAREHEIINNLKNNKDDVMYTIDDYVSYDLNEQERELLDKIDKLKHQDKSSYIVSLKQEGLNKKTYEERFTYLLTLIKIFNYKEDNETVEDLIGFVESLITRDSIPDAIKETTEKKLGLYKLN